MKKIHKIALTIFPLIVIGAYLYVRYAVLKSEDFKPDNSKAKNLLDLRPAIISKLQQLVKDGSDGNKR